MKLSLEDDLWWTSILHLPTWAGYQSRFGPYTSIDKPTPSDGKVRLVFAPDGRGNEALTAPELQLVSWFEAHEEAVSQAVKTAILASCSPYMSEHIVDEYDLKHLIGLYSINIHQLVTNAIPYIGFEFGCNWDEEHGLGVMMHGTRLVEIGSAETALHLWVAQKDADGAEVALDTK